MFQQMENLELESLKDKIGTGARELMRRHQFGQDQYRDEDVLDIAACAAVYEGYLSKLIRKGSEATVESLNPIKDFAKRLDGLIINERMR